MFQLPNQSVFVNPNFDSSIFNFFGDIRYFRELMLMSHVFGFLSMFEHLNLGSLGDTSKTRNKNPFVIWENIVISPVLAMVA